ncbi:MAG: thiamine-phosphate diphosphorylase [Spirochaetes bacterium RBG_13_51_14]|nr:MAG: thiamine-phosphate diphosphorylase [Spirochaetes bacterium RBG_13_51_14]
MDKQIYAAIDANINRALEGIRVCEDVMRFCLRRDDLSARLKEIRHGVAAAVKGFSRGLLLYGRDVDADAQKFLDLVTERSRESIEELFAANLHRAMEAVRSLEEFFKLARHDGEENPFQRIRFSLYALEREAVPALRRQHTMRRFIRALYAILDSAYLPGGNLRGAAAAMIRGGASIIQLRMKTAGRKQLLAAATEIAGLCRAQQTLFIVNDHPDIAILTGADGLHLGMNDLGLRDARRIVPPYMIIGVTAYSPDDVLRSAEEGADYVAVGPVYDTVYHSGSGIITLTGVGVDVISRARSAVNIPIVAIGGITPEGAGAVISAGADSVAVTSYLYKDNKIEENCRSMVRILA